MTKQEAFADSWAKEIAQYIVVDLPPALIGKHLSAGLKTAFAGMALAADVAETGALPDDFKVNYDVYL